MIRLNNGFLSFYFSYHNAKNNIEEIQSYSIHFKNTIVLIQYNFCFKIPNDKKKQNICFEKRETLEN